jgi:hypothetical protein
MPFSTRWENCLRHKTIQIKLDPAKHLSTAYDSIPKVSGAIPQPAAGFFYRPPDFLRQLPALLRHTPDILRQLPEFLRDISEVLRHVPNPSGTRRSFSAVCPHFSGTRRSIAATCRRFTEVCRNHSDTPKSFKNPYISMIYS